jgi:hypothetical protein
MVHVALVHRNYEIVQSTSHFQQAPKRRAQKNSRGHAGSREAH